MFLKERKYAWVLLLFLWVYGFFGSLGRFVQAYYQKDISEFMSVGRSFLGFTWSVNIFIGAVCAPFGGWLVDRLGIKKVMVLTSLLGIFSISIVLIFTNPLGYFIGFGILSGLVGVGASTTYVLITNWFKHHRAKAMMILGSAGSLGLATLTPILVYNKDRLGWINIYWALLIIGCLFIPLTIVLVRKNKAENQVAKEPTSENALPTARVDSASKITGEENKMKWFVALANYFRNPTLLIVMFALFTCGFNMGTVEMNLMAIHQVAHVSDAMFATSLSLLGILELVGGLTFSFLLDIMNRALALSCLYFIRIVAFVFLFMHFELSPILFSLIFGASYLGAIPGGILVVTESQKTSQNRMGVQIGILILIHQVGGAIASVAGGMNYDVFHNYQLLIAMNTGLVAVSAYGYYYIYRSAKTKQVKIKRETAGMIGS